MFLLKKVFVSVTRGVQLRTFRLPFLTDEYEYDKVNNLILMN